MTPPEPDPNRPATEPMAPGDEAPEGAASTGEDLCPACAGTGRVNGESCAVCDGTGQVNRAIGGG